LLYTHTQDLVLHVAINYKEDELTIFFVVFVLFKNRRARRAGESFGSFFLFLFAYDIFMCGLFLCRPPHLYTAHFYIIDPTIYTEEKKTKKNIFLFLFYLFFVNILLLLRFFRTDFISIKPIRCWPAFGMHIYTTQREREAKQLTIYIYILRCLKKTGATAVFGLSSSTACV
jgi:hypothetical protein